MSEKEINDYLSKCDEDLANNVIYRVYGMPGPIFMENDTPTPEPGPEPPTPGPDYSIPFYVENITQEEETLTILLNYIQIDVEYSTDMVNWGLLPQVEEGTLGMTLSPNEKVYLRSETNVWGYIDESPNSDQITGVSKVGGNIMSLLYGENFTGDETEFPSSDSLVFCGLFMDNINLLDASELILPATTLTEGCYVGMFYGCTSLTTAPELPATTLAEDCYARMFMGCTSLTTTPTLPATTLAQECYCGMFMDCTSLTSAPTLPATTLAQDCYSGMFAGCTSLTINNIPTLPATTLAGDCYSNMFSNNPNLGMDLEEYDIWCSENIPSEANYNESIHGRLFDLKHIFDDQ